MPGELSDPEFSIPFHYDPRYEPGTNVFESRPLNVDQILHAVSWSERGCAMNKEELKDAQAFLLSKGMESRNPGDQEVQDTIRGYLKSKKSARKVARRHGGL